MPAAPGRPRRAVTVRDAIGDLPPISNGADVEEMPFSGAHPQSTPCQTVRLFAVHQLRPLSSVDRDGRD